MKKLLALLVLAGALSPLVATEKTPCACPCEDDEITKTEENKTSELEEVRKPEVLEEEGLIKAPTVE